MEVLPFAFCRRSLRGDFCTELNAIRSDPALPRKADSAHRRVAGKHRDLTASLILHAAMQRENFASAVFWGLCQWRTPALVGRKGCMLPCSTDGLFIVISSGSD